MRVLLISTYDLGRQPFGLASPAAWLRQQGVEVACADLSRERLPEDALRAADLIGFYLPMHTATRLALPVIDLVRTVNPHARLCAYGLYAPLNTALLTARGVTHVLGAEFEGALVDLALGRSDETDARPGALPRLSFRPPDRTLLPPLARYATLQVGRERRTTGSTETTRGCKHLCRHCPIVPVYGGQFRVIPLAVVLADIRTQVDAGARHITFADPDFFNGPRHARAVIEAFGCQFPGVSYDVTIKIEHLRRHADLLPPLRDSGCAFVTSAVESIDDRVLACLEKGHTRRDFEAVVQTFERIGLTLAPTFVAFTPWTTLSGYVELLQAIAGLGLVEQVAPIQLALRLLVTEGSRLLELPEIRTHLQGFDAGSLTYPWRHEDARVDALQTSVSSVAGRQLNASRRELFERVWALAHDAAGIPAADLPAPRPRTDVPYLNEPWYC